MAHFIEFELEDGREIIVNLDIIREIQPDLKAIGITLITVHRAMPLPQSEMYRVKMSYTTLKNILCPPSMKLIQ